MASLRERTKRAREFIQQTITEQRRQEASKPKIAAETFKKRIERTVTKAETFKKRIKEPIGPIPVVETDYLGKGEPITIAPPPDRMDYLSHVFDVVSTRKDVPSAPPPKPSSRQTFVDVEIQAGKEAGLTLERVSPKLVEATRHEQYKKYKAVESEAERLKAGMRGSPIERLASLGAWVTTGFISWEDPFGIMSTAQVLTGDIEGAIWTKAQAMHGLDVSIKRGHVDYLTKIYTGPMAFTGVTYGISTGIGAGIGSLKAVSPTVGKLAEIGLVGYGGYETAYKPIVSGDIQQLYSNILSVGVTLPVIIPGYKKGYSWGYGKTEAYLYKIHTYKPGTPKYIRFEEALKIGKLLEDVQPQKIKPLDFAKDIMRMDPKAAGQLTSFLKQYPRTVIGGSVASYTQIVGARPPRDVDIFIQRIIGGTTKRIVSAKQFFGKLRFKAGKHVIDIHGKELYKPGRYHRFGFVSKEPIKIGEYKYFRGGEQLFRKGVSSIIMEMKYRHGVYPGFPKTGTMHAPKDIADFVTHARSLITSAKQHWLTRWKGVSAEKHLKLFLHPEKAPSYGIRQPTGFESLLKAFTKPVKPKIVYKPWGYEYAYPKVAYPSYYTPIAISSYFAPKYPSYKPSAPLRYKPVVSIVGPPSKPPTYTPTKSPPYKPPTYTPPKVPPYKPPTYTPPKTPPLIPPVKKPLLVPDEPRRKKRRPSIFDFVDPGYMFREFKLPTIAELLSGKRKTTKKSKKKTKKRWR